MPRYFFHIVGYRREEDKIGTNLPTDEAARLAAVIHAGEVTIHEAGFLMTTQSLKVEAVDEHGKLLYVVETSVADPHDVA